MANLDRSLIARLPQFQGLGATDLDRILAPARSSRYAKDSAVFEEGVDSYVPYAGKLKEGNILMCVHVENSEEAGKVREIFSEEKAESISTGSEASVPSR